MTSERITIQFVQSDTLPLIRVQLIDQATGLPVNLLGVDVTASFRVRAYGATTSLFDASMTKVDGGAYGWLKVASWPADAFDLDEGIYEGQVTVVLDSGTQTMTRSIRLRVKPKFATPA